jgi:hypothetical protein
VLDLLRDPLWQFVGAVLAVLALVVSFVIYQLQRQRKGVTYDVLSRTHLLTVREELEGKLQVLYEGEPAKSISLLVVKIWNSGNQPILSTDYERPISFCTGEASRILSADVTDVEPSGLMVKVNTNENAVTLSSTLLNPGDALTLKLLVRDTGNALCADARIVGVKSVQRAGHSSRLFTALATTGMVLLAAGFYVFFANVPRSEAKPPIPLKAFIGIGIATIGYAVLIYALVKVRRLRIRLVRFVRGG